MVNLVFEKDMKKLNIINTVHYFFEEWRDESCIDKHMKSKHFTEIFPLFSECLVKEAEAGLYKKNVVTSPLYFLMYKL